MCITMDSGNRQFWLRMAHTCAGETVWGMCESTYVFQECTEILDENQIRGGLGQLSESRPGGMGVENRENGKKLEVDWLLNACNKSFPSLETKDLINIPEILEAVDTNFS